MTDIDNYSPSEHDRALDALAADIADPDAASIRAWMRGISRVAAAAGITPRRALEIALRQVREIGPIGRAEALIHLAARRGKPYALSFDEDGRPVVERGSA